MPPLPDAPPPRDKRGARPARVAFAKSLVLYEDDEVLALNKPAGLAVQGGTKTIEAHRPAARRPGARGWSGRGWSTGSTATPPACWCWASRPAAAAKLAGAFAKRRAQKTYWAIVAGFPKPGEGVLDLPLVKKGVGDREMVRAGRSRRTPAPSRPRPNS